MKRLSSKWQWIRSSCFALFLLSITPTSIGQNRSVVDSLENHLKNINDGVSKVDVLNLLSREMNHLWENKKAMGYAQAAFSLADKLGYIKGEGIARKNMGSINIDERRFDEARANILSGMELSRKAKDYNNLGESYLLIGKLNTATDNYADAMKYYDSSLAVFRKEPDRINTAFCYLEMSRVNYFLDNYPEAFRQALYALKIFEKTRNTYGMVSCNITIGAIHSMLEDYEASKNNYTVCFKILESSENRKQFADVCFRMADYYWNVNNCDSSMSLYIKAKKIYEDLGDDYDLGRCYKSIAEVLIEWKRYPEALGNLKRALNLFEKTGNKNQLIDIYIDIGDVNFRQGKAASKSESGRKFTEAKDYYQKSISVAREIGDKHGTWLGQMRLYHLDSVTGRFDLALNHYITARIISDSVFSQISARQIEKLQVQYETEKKDKEIELKKQEIEKQKLLRNVMLIGILVIILFGIVVFRSFKWRKKLEKQEAIIGERKRISADLHDDIGSGLSKISLLSEMVKQQAKTTEAKEEAEKIATTSRELLDSIREIIWALNANNDYLENLVSYIRRYAAEYFENSGVKFNIDIPENIPATPVSGEFRRNVFYAVKEALHNIVKHSGAKEAGIRFMVEKGTLSIVISDNGKGFTDGEMNRFGNGIRNMRSRMEKIKGNFSMENHDGTKISLVLPVKNTPKG